MDLLTEWCINSEKYSGRMFASNPPRDTLLLWSNNNGVTITGISIVRQIGYLSDNQLTPYVTNILESLGFDIDIIEYSDDVINFRINGVDLTSEQAANFIANKYQISIDQSHAKAVNNTNRVTDPFHIWSRNVFSGKGVHKVDIDALRLSEDRTRILTVLEMKNSPRIDVKNWTPYIHANSDRPNYVSLIGFAKQIGCDFVTAHISKADRENLRPEDLIGTFKISSTEIQSVKPIQTVLQQFASPQNRRIHTLKQLLS